MIGFYLFLGFEKLLMLLPHSWRKALFFGIAKLAFYIDKKHRLVIRQNLEFIYGEKADSALIEQVSRYCYKNLANNALFILESRHMSLEAFQQKVTFENRDVVENIQKQGRPIVFISSHFGAWEIGSNAIGAFVEPLLFIYKKMKNPYFEEYLLFSRTKFGMQPAERHGAMKAMFKRMRAKKSVGILIDTNIKKSDGLAVEFLGKSVHHVSTPAYLARKFDAAIVPALIYTDDHEHYRVKFFDAIESNKALSDEEDLLQTTQATATWLSQAIQKDPKYWFWMHRRFKTDYPAVYEKRDQ